MAEGYDVELLVEPGQSTHTFDSDSERTVFDAEDMRRVSQIIDGNGIRGTRSRYYGRVVAGNYTVSGSLTLRPGQTQLDVWLPRILYGTETSDNWGMADGIPSGSYFGMIFNKVGDIHQFNDCVVNRATFSASAGEPLTLRMEILGKTETQPSWPGSYPTDISYDANSLPVLMSSGTLTLGGSTYNFESFECVIDNMVEAQFRNSATAVAFVPQDRTVTLTVELDYSATVATNLYGPTPATGFAAEAVIAGDIDFVPATNKSLKFNFPKLIAPKQTPVVPGKSAIMYPVTFQAFGDTVVNYTDYELYITNDLTG